MKIHINDHLDGDTRVDSRLGTRLAGVRFAARLDERGLERLRGRLDHPRRVLLRDFVIFECKLFMDWVKGPIIAQIALIGFIIDLVRPGGRNFGVFYKVLTLGERLDIWLSLYGPSRRAAEDPEGLMGQSREGSPTLLGQLERLVHRIVVGDDAGLEAGEELYPRGYYAPEPATSPAGAAAPAPGGGASAAEAAPAPGGGAASGPTPEAPSSAAPTATPPGAPTPGPAPSPSAEPARSSSFEVENFGR